MIIVTGVAGAGKSTQCTRLVATGMFQWLSVGAMLRNSNDPRVKESQSRGEIVDDLITLPLVEEELINRNDTPELLLDGFPRSDRQVSWLISMQSKGKPYSVRAVIHITLSKEMAIYRLTKRGRKDDTEEAILNRMKIYEEIVMPINEKMKEAGIPIIDINGDDTEEVVFQSIIESIK